MSVLEKILEEIEEMRDIMESTVAINCFEKDCEHNDCTICVCERAMEIIRSHMDEVENDGWISVKERLPEIREIVKVTVHSSEWIGDYDSDWVPEEDKIHHQEEYHVHDGYLNENGVWIFYDDEYSENICEKKFGTNKGRIYDVVIAWQPLPNPYKGE